MFDIQIFNEKPSKRFGIKYVSGLITMGSFQEGLDIPLCYWNKEEYKKHWNNQITQILDKSCDRSFLITQIYEPERHYPKYADSIEWWVLFREDERVFIHHSFLILDELEAEFTLSGAHQFIGERETHTDDGDKISEWEIPIFSLKKFLAKNKVHLKSI